MFRANIILSFNGPFPKSNILLEYPAPENLNQKAKVNPFIPVEGMVGIWTYWDRAAENIIAPDPTTLSVVLISGPLNSFAL